MQLRFLVEDPSHIGEIRRVGISMSEDLGLDQTLAGKISIVITELGTNIIKHAGRGEVLLSRQDSSIHIIAIDRGPGMTNVRECMSDGYSTGGTAGNGLGAIRRQSHHFDLFTQSGKGTIIHSMFSKDGTLPPIMVGGVCLPLAGEQVSGDSWSYSFNDKILKIIVADGLGHGHFAHEASSLAMDVFCKDPHIPSVNQMNFLHSALRSTRGAAISIAELDFTKKIVNFCGVGNVSGSLFSPGNVKRLITYNGTIGVQFRKAQEMTYKMEKDAVIVIYSDGLLTQWSILDYPGLINRDPFVIAGLLYRDHSRKTDDISVIVAKEMT